MPTTEKIQLPRGYKPPGFGQVTSCQVHMFSDASENGYGKVAYLRLTDDRGQICVSFILGKSRVSPLKKITIPRMELTAATITVKICILIHEGMDFSVTETFYWTDSMSVLRYICNDSARYHTFVANRVNLIRDATSVDQWNYIESKSNAADASSRGMKIEKFLRADLWFRGPEFLQHDQSEWPQNHPDESSKIPIDDSEVNRVVNTAVETETSDIVHELFCHYSDWTRLKRAVAYLRLFIRYLQTKTKLRQENPNSKKPQTRSGVGKKGFQLELSVCEMKGAEKAIMRVVQRYHFADTIRALQQKGTGNTRSGLHKLDPFLHEGLVRVGGRLEQGDMTFDTKHPVILPKHSHVSTLILRDIHRRVGHLGKNMMMSVLRQQYWMIGGNSGIKGVISKCVQCKRYQAKVLEQKMADLPVDRLTPDEPPYSHTGIDFFGPFHVTRGRSSVKRYGVIFVCLASRAVHLELAYSLDTDSCINALRRFIARRGSVKMIRSDNWTNLVSCEKVFRSEIEKLNNEKLRDVLIQKNITWEFNPPTASHFGGIWERMIRTVRKILHSLMQQQAIRLDDEALHTLLCEVESILNNRPITYTPVDPSDLTVLTPNHLLQLQPRENMPPGVFNKGDAYIRRRWKQVQYLADQFWKRWKTEYITQLQERQKWFAAKENIAIGDVVLMVENSPKNSWAMGKVIKTFTDKKDL